MNQYFPGWVLADEKEIVYGKYKNNIEKFPLFYGFPSSLNQ